MNRRNHRIFGPAAAAGALALLLAACGSINDPRENKLGNFLVAPGKYQLYDCVQLTQQSTGFVIRERELREAMIKAEASPGGGVVSAVAYRAEYGQVQGNLDELRREVTEKKCDPPPPGLFASGPQPAAAPAAKPR